MAYTTIDDPSAHFQIATYTGNGSDGNAITFDGNSNLQPDWLWGKERTTSGNQNAFDTSRGLNKRLTPDQADAENTDATTVTAMNTNGFTLGSSNNINENTVSTVAWCWKAKCGSTTTNDASSTGVGTIDSVYQANTTAGFSIVTHTGSGSAGNIAHGLGAVPEWILTKNRSQAASWANYHVGAGAEYYLELDTSDAREAGSSVWGDTTPSSTTFRVGGANTKTNSSSDNFVSYCFTPIQGYSKFGSYTGNGNADGAFVYTGFKPAWLLGKRTDGTGNSWFMFDTKRDTENVMDAYLYANETSAETTGTGRVDFLSNGFKWRNTAAAWNGSGNTYVYMAFAEHPFVSSKGVPVTAR